MVGGVLRGMRICCPRSRNMMQQTFESAAESMYVAIGPSAGLCCYEVDEPVLEPIRAFSFWPSVVRRQARDGPS